MMSVTTASLKRLTGLLVAAGALASAVSGCVPLVIGGAAATGFSSTAGAGAGSGSAAGCSTATTWSSAGGVTSSAMAMIAPDRERITPSASAIAVFFISVLLAVRGVDDPDDVVEDLLCRRG